MEPTGCYDPMPPDVVGAVCKTTGGETMETIPFPSDVLDVSDLLDSMDIKNGTITVTVTQNFSPEEVGVAIQAGLESCIVNEGVGADESLELAADCMEGYAAVTVVVYFDESFEADKCDACKVDELSELGGDYEFCAYSIEIPCSQEEVPCGEPSASPSGSFYPSEAPSEAPTKSASPSASPTTSPSSSPTVSPSASPTSSPTASPSDSPSASPTASPSDSPSASPTTAAPSASPSYSCPERTATLVENQGETMYEDSPIKITMQNETHVGFQVLNTWGKPASSIFTQYHAGSFGETECVSEENVEVELPLETEFVAQCMHHTKISIMNIWVTDCTEDQEQAFLDLLVDNAEVPECCHPGDECKTVQYTFKIPCVDPCPPEDGAAAADNGRRLSNEHTVHDLVREKRREESSTKEFEALTGHADDNDAEDHFCVVEDYPCGANLDKVHVCHYSARDGYKTFCVPEADSDALRFYPKDYCGPCVGGYSTV